MTSATHTHNVTSGMDSVNAVHLMLMESNVKMRAENPEQVMKEIEVRATRVSSILENILHEPHGHPDWGLND